MDEVSTRWGIASQLALSLFLGQWKAWSCNNMDYGYVFNNIYLSLFTKLLVGSILLFQISLCTCQHMLSQFTMYFTFAKWKHLTSIERRMKYTALDMGPKINWVCVHLFSFSHFFLGFKISWVCTSLLSHSHFIFLLLEIRIDFSKQVLNFLWFGYRKSWNKFISV